MYLRERLHDDLEMVAVLGPAEPGLTLRLAEVIAEYLHRPESAILRRPRRTDGRWGVSTRVVPVPVIDRVIRSCSPGLSPSELALSTIGRRPRDLPLVVASSGELIAFSFPHDLFDGASAWAHITPILQGALTGPEPGQPKPVLRWPLAAALRQTRLVNASALAAARAVRRTAERTTERPAQLAEPVSIDVRRRQAGWAGLMLSSEQLRALDASSSPAHLASAHARRRTLRSMKIAETVLAGLAAATPEDADYRVRMPIDLRRYTPRGRRVDGPFSTSYPLGTLRSSDNSAPALTVRLGEIVRSNAPLAALAGDLVGLTRAMVRHPLTSRKHGASEREVIDLTLSILPSRLPAHFWVPGVERVNAAMQFSPHQPTGPLIQIAEMDDMVSISLWDETGAIDQGAFRKGVHDALAARLDPMTTGSERTS